MLSTTYEVVTVLGGEATVAAITGFTERHVLVWRYRDWFPNVTYEQIRFNLLMRGLDVDPNLFGPLDVNPQKNNFQASQPFNHAAF